MADLLSDSDQQYLTDKGFEFEALVEGGMILLIIHNFALPSGYQPVAVDLLLRLPLQFPEVGPDMFWTDPVVTYSESGGPPQATGPNEPYAGRTWQRWSRHFGQSLWRPGIDDLRSYLRLIRATLEREVGALAA